MTPVPSRQGRGRAPGQARILGSVFGLGLALAVLAAHWGCQGKPSPTSPVAPFKGYSLSFSVPITKELKASLLGVANNEVYYSVAGPDMAPVTGTTGSVATTFLNAGSFDFSFSVPQGPSRLMSFQMNDASDHRALAIGAVLSDINAGGVSDIAVTLGSVVRNCYTVDTSSLDDTPTPGVINAYFTFQSDSLSSSPAGADLAVAISGGGFGLVAQASNSIAYLGNGPLVDFDTVPGSGSFAASSVASKQAAGASPSYLQAADVYCVSLGAGGANGHAWIQIVNPDQPFGDNPPFPKGPLFLFRVNTSLPYYAYDPINADAGTCPTHVFTPTTIPTNTLTPTSSPTFTLSPTPTFSFTPTLSPTNSFSPTVTNTPFVPTSTFSFTPTFSPTVTATFTHTFSPTNSNTPFVATSTATSSPTLSPTATATFTHSSSPTNTYTPFVPTSTFSSSPTPSSTVTGTATITSSPTRTPTSSPTNTASSITPTPTLTPTSSPTNSATLSPSSTPTGSPVLTSSPTSTPTTSPTGSPTSAPSLTSTPTSSPTITRTLTPLPTPFLASAAVSCLFSDSGNGACRVFQLALVADGAVSFPSQSYALVKDLSNGNSVYVGPWNYSGSGTTFLSDLSGESFGVTSSTAPVSAQLSVVLYDQSKSVSFGTLSAGSPISLEAPPGYIAATSLACQTTLEDGNCSVFNLTVDAYNPLCGSVTQMSMVRLTDLSNGSTTLLGPVTYTCTGFTWTLSSQQMGVTQGQQALNQQFQVQLYDSTGTTVWDSKPAGPLNLEYPGDAIASSSLACLTADSGNGACQDFLFTINANGPPGVNSTSYAYVLDNQNSDYVWVGPWSYSGNGTSYSVTLTGSDFGLTTADAPVSANFTVKLYNENQNQVLDTSVPAGSPLTIEAPSEYIYNNSFSCQTTAEDGNCQYFTFNTDLDNPGSTPVTSLVKLTDLTSGVSVFVGPVTNIGGNRAYSVTLTGALLGLTAGQAAVSHVFQEQLTDATGVTVLDSQPVPGTFSYEYASPYLSGTSLSCVVSDSGNQACQSFALTIDANGPTGVNSTSYAYVFDSQNSNYVWVGPWSYSGNGTSYSVTLNGADFGLTTNAAPVSTNLMVKLYDETQTQILDTSLPAGSPLTLEAPSEFIYGSSYNSLNCFTAAEDGNCEYFTFNTDLDAPAATSGTPVTSLVKLTDLTSGVSVFIGPVTNVGGNRGYAVTLHAADFGLTPGQVAANQAFQEQLYDASGVTLLDVQPVPGTFSFEYPSPYLVSASVSVLSTDGVNGAVQRFLLTVKSNGPAGVLSTNYASVIDTQNAASTFMGPWSYTGVGGSYAVTLNGTDFGLTTNAAPVSTGFTVRLYDQTQTHWLDTTTPTGAPITLEAPSEFIYGAAYDTFGCITTAEDGNCEYFTFNTDLDAPAATSGTPVTSLVRLTDLTLGASVTIGPVTNIGGNRGYSVTLHGADFGLIPGQTAVSQVFQEQLYDASGVTLLDQQPAQTFSFEYPSPYLSSASVTVLSTDGVNGAVQRFLLTVKSNGPAGVLSTNYASVIDTQNAASTFVGPWSYTGVGGSYAVTLNGADFGLTTNAAPVSTGFTIKLYDQTQTHWLDTTTPTGAPITLEAPSEFIYGAAQDNFSCLTTAEDGNCEYFTYNTDLVAPGTTPVTTEVKLEDLTSAVTLTLGPFIHPGGGNKAFAVTLHGADFGLIPGQTAVSQVFQEQLYDASGVTLLDQQPAQTFSFEYPSPYLSSASVTVLSTDGVNGAVQRFLLTVKTNGPAGVLSTNYASVIDTQNAASTFVGPWSYTGVGGSYAVTLNGADFGLTTNAAPVSTGFTIKLYDQTQTHWLDTTTPTGAPITLEAPSEFIYGAAQDNFSCLTTAEDGNCEYFTYNTDLVAPGTTPVTTEVKLEDLTSAVTLTLGPFIHPGGGNKAFAVTLHGADFGLIPGQTAVSQVFQEQLYDASGVTLLDQQPAQTFSFEYPSPYLSGSSISCVLSDSGNGACQGFDLTINPNGPPGVPSISYALVTDTQNSSSVYVGPITYTGNGDSYSVTLFGDDFGLAPSAPVSCAFTVKLYDETETHWLDTDVPAGSPLTLEAPTEYIYGAAYNSFNCVTSAEDGNCVTFVYSTDLDVPGSTPVTTQFALVDLSNGVTTFAGPVTNPGGGNRQYSVTLNGSNFLAAGQAGVNQVFEELLYDASGVTVLDSQTAPDFSIENDSAPTTASLGPVTISCLLTDPGTGACQSFILNLSANATSGPAASYAAVADLTNGHTVTVGPWSYTGSGTSFPVTLKASDFNVITLGSPVSTAFAVTLLNGAKTTVLGSGTPVGSPLTLVAPVQYITSNSFSCNTTVEDGNCETFTLNTSLVAPGSATVTTFVRLVDQSAGGGPITVNLGPVTDTNGGGISPSYTLSAQQFGLTASGQTAVSQVFEELLYDASGVTLLDSKSPGTLNLETSSSYLSSSSISCVQADPNNGACQQFLLTLNTTGPAGVLKTNYGYVTDLTNARSVYVGPWSYTGTGNYSVTLTGIPFSLTTAGQAVSTAFAVTLYDGTKSTVLGYSIPTGAPITLEAPIQYISSDSLSCQTTLEDGNCETFNFNTGLVAPGSATVTTFVRLVDQTAGGGPITLNLGPVTDTNGGGISPSYTLSAQQFGLTASGQTAVSQVFEELLYDASGVTLLDSKSPGTLNLETSSSYLSSSSISCVQADPNNGACQQFLLTLNTTGPAGVLKTNYGYVTDLTNARSVYVGPWSYTGTGNYSVTLTGIPFSLTTAGQAVSTAFAVTLYDGTKSTVLGYSIPTGAPITLEAPIQYISSDSFSCQTTAEDGNCETFTFNTVLVAPGSATVTTFVRLVDQTAGGGPITVNLGPVTDINGGGTSSAYTLSAQQFGVTTAGQTAVSQVFEELLYDASGVTLLDSKSPGTLNLETSSPYLSSSSISCVQADPNNGACQQFLLTLNTNGPAGVLKTNYGYVTDLTNAHSTYVGPWSYTGGGSYSVTLTGIPFNLTTAGQAVSTAFAVTLYDGTKSTVLGYSIPTGAPITLEAPIQYISSDSFSCQTTAEDGNCETFTFNTVLVAPGSATVTTFVRLVDQTAGGGPITVNLGPVTDINGGGTSSAYTLSAQQFGVTTAGQTAVSQVFEELLYDASGVTLLDSKSPGILNLETSTPYLSSSSITCLESDPNNGACQQFLLTLNTTGPAGVLKTNYGYVTDLTNAHSTYVGPWSTTGTGSYSVTLTGIPFSLTTAGQAVSTAFAVTLYDGTKSTVLGYSIPTGAPITLEAPLEYISSDAFTCNTTAEDGNCETFNLSTYLDSPGSATVVSLLKLLDLSNGITVALGPVTDTSGGSVYSTYTLAPEQFGVTTAGQTAVSQLFEELLYDASGVTLLDSKSPGTVNLENPSPYLASSAITCLASDPNNGACQAFQLTLKADGPAGIPKTSYATVMDLTDGTAVLVGPWSYTGSGTSYAVTLSGRELGLATAGQAVSTQLAVTLLNETQTKALGISIPTGSPITLETPSGYIASTSLSAQATAEDGNFSSFNFNIYAYTPNCAATQTSFVRLLDMTSGVAVTLGPVTYTCNSYNWVLTAAQFGLAPGQAAVSQAFQTELYDATGTKVWDVKPTGTINLEYPSDYITSSAVTCLTSDGVNGACQSFQLTVKANGPAGVSQVAYAYVEDLASGTQVLVGPWGFTGSGGSHAVTLSGYEFGMTTPNNPVSTQLAVTLYNGAQNQILSVSTPTGSPITLEEPPAYIASSSLSCQTTAEDGNCKDFNFSFYAYTPNCATTQVSMVKIVDESNGTSVLEGPVTYTCNSYGWSLNAGQFGLSPGQAAVSQAFQAELYDSTGTKLWDTKSMGTLNLEGP